MCPYPMDDTAQNARKHLFHINGLEQKSDEQSERRSKSTLKNLDTKRKQPEPHRETKQ